jgi:predicted secreted protein
LGHALSIAGLLLQVDNGASPDTFQTVANVTDLKLPLSCATVKVTNIGDLWEAMFPTLHSMGKIAFTLQWIPEEVTHRNSPSAGSVGAGLMWLFMNANTSGQAGLRNWQLIIPDGNNSTIAFPAFVTDFAIDAKVGNVFQASIELTHPGGATGPQMP